MNDQALRNQVIRLAYENPNLRADLLNVVKEADMLSHDEEDDIGKEVSGPLLSEPDEPYMKGEFTQQENTELHDMQVAGDLSDGVADPSPKTAALKLAAAEKALRVDVIRLAHAHPEFRAELLPLLAKVATDEDEAADDDDDEAVSEGSKKATYSPVEAAKMIAAALKSGGCEKLPPALRENCEKKSKGGDKKDDDKDEKKEAALRASIIRLAHSNPTLRKDLLPLLAGE